MNYKIQSWNLSGWLDLMGEFDTIKDAQEFIPKIEESILEKYFNSSYLVTSILRIVEKDAESTNDHYVYPNIKIDSKKN